MAITASQILSSEIDNGAVSLAFSHTTNTGVTLGPFVERRPLEADHEAFIAASATAITNGLIASELSDNESKALDNDGNPTFAWCTVAQFRARLRERFRDSFGWDLVRLGRFIHNQNLTDTQLKNLFSVNDAQLVTLKAKLLALHSRFDDVQAQAGQ